ncbi:MAG: hypothetical protein JWO43_497 [Candidatus Adlerbacteria bacterium]|nr:hypothetical protein [Candidatus Adlerbacteria bacterium]
MSFIVVADRVEYFSSIVYSDGEVEKEARQRRVNNLVGA